MTQLIKKITINIFYHFQVEWLTYFSTKDFSEYRKRNRICCYRKLLNTAVQIMKSTKNCTVSCLTGRYVFRGMCGVKEGEPGERGMFWVRVPIAVAVHQRLVATARGTECGPLIRLLVQVLNAVQEYLSCKHFKRG